MRIFIGGSLLIIMAGISGCGMGTSPAASATTQMADAKTCLMQSGGTSVLKVTTSADTNCVTGDGTLHFTGPQYEVEMWLAPTAKTVDDAVGLVSTQIVSEFKDFKPDHTTELTVAGLPAKRLVGAGHEADDGDPGDADVIVFKVGDHIFVSCTHGESLNPVAQAAMLTMVQTAQTP